MLSLQQRPVIRTAVKEAAMSRGVSHVRLSVFLFSCAFLLASCAGGGDPASIFRRTCSRCHDLDTALRQDFDREMWTAVVRRMSDNAASRYGPIPEGEQRAIADYLARNAGKQ
jgi:hypothetical protein